MGATVRYVNSSLLILSGGRGDFILGREFVMQILCLIVYGGDSVTGAILSHRLRRVLHSRGNSTWGRRHLHGGGDLSSNMFPSPGDICTGEILYCDTGAVAEGNDVQCGLWTGPQRRCDRATVL